MTVVVGGPSLSSPPHTPLPGTQPRAWPGAKQSKLRSGSVTAWTSRALGPRHGSSRADSSRTSGCWVPLQRVARCAFGCGGLLEFVAAAPPRTVPLGRPPGAGPSLRPKTIRLVSVQGHLELRRRRGPRRRVARQHLDARVLLPLRVGRVGRDTNLTFTVPERDSRILRPRSAPGPVFGCPTESIPLRRIGRSRAECPSVAPSDSATCGGPRTERGA
jgi:hypothetical protein